MDDINCAAVTRLEVMVGCAVVTHAGQHTEDVGENAARSCVSRVVVWVLWSTCMTDFECHCDMIKVVLKIHFGE